MKTKTVRWLSGLIAALFLWSAVAVSALAATGDLDGVGGVTVQDALKALRIAVQLARRVGNSIHPMR